MRLQEVELVLRLLVALRDLGLGEGEERLTGGERLLGRHDPVRKVEAVATEAGDGLGREECGHGLPRLGCRSAGANHPTSAGGSRKAICALA